LAIQIAVTGDGSDQTARARRDLGNALRDQGAFAEAESLYRRSLEVSRQRFGPVDPIVARTQNELALLLAERGGHDEAEALLNEIVSAYARLYPQGHPMVGTTLRNLGVLRLRQGRAADAVAALRDAVAMYQLSSDESAFIPRAHRYLAHAALDAGDAETAAAAAREAILRFQRMGLGGHPAAADALHTLELAQGRLAPR
jgi:tetratricopeptide (TPR) repeat protein